MAGRHIARLLAPLALVGCAVALYAVVTGTLNDDQVTKRAGQTTTTEGGDRSSSGGGEKRRGQRSRRKSYTVKAGDTPSTIAERTGVTLEEIERLNPDLDPRSLSPGDRIKLRR